jgi:hypothetical protein
MTNTIQIPFTITDEIVENIIVGAIEGGSDYWCELGEGIPERDDKGTPLSMRITQNLLNTPGFKLEILDAENEEEVLGYLTLESFKEGVSIVAKQYPWHFANLISGNDDAETADVFFQCATMGGIVFG